MRTLPVILIAAFTALVIAASAVVTSHFGMRDWPTPPMPDTATRLITPTEAAGRVGERAEREPGDVESQTAATAPGETRRSRGPERAERRRGELRRGAVDGRGRPADDRTGSRRDDEDPDSEPTPATGPDGGGDQPAQEPSAPTPVAPVAPVAPAGGGVARDDDVIQQPPAAGSESQDDVYDHDGDDQDADDPNGDDRDDDDDDRDDGDDRAGDLRRGPVRNLLDLLP